MFQSSSRTFRSAVVIGAALLFSAPFAAAHMGAKGIVRERMEMMKSIAHEMKTVAAMVRGKTAFDGTRIEASAKRVAAHGTRIVAMFPKGSGGGVSEAANEIWTDPDGFRRAADDMIDAANRLRVAAQSGEANAVKGAFGDLGKSCGGCHRDYRVKKN